MIGKHDPFYDSKAWREKRAHIKRRDRHLCQSCLKRKRVTVATTVHHVKPFKEFPDLALVDSNLVSLCRDCHEDAHDNRQGQHTPDEVMQAQLNATNAILVGVGREVEEENKERDLSLEKFKKKPDSKTKSKKLPT